MKHNVFLTVAAILAAQSVAAPMLQAQDDKGVTFQPAGDTQLEIRIDGKVFGVLNHGGDWNKPFLYPVHAPNGANVLRPIIPTKDQQGSSKDGTDHFHHKGVWLSVDSVNDERLNFWHEQDRIVSSSFKTQTNSDGTGTLTMHNTWMQGDKPLVKETTTATFHPSRIAVYRIELAAVDKDVTFHDTKEGFFAVRIAHTMREMEGGHITNADGLKGEQECWGKPTAWIDYYGDVDGKTCGVTLMDHPNNFRESRYHVRRYGLFAISPFGPKKYSNNKEPAAPVTISPGKDSLKLTYGLYIHDGDTAAGEVTVAYEAFLKATK